ncbi:copper homeostasis membrane protein CopD (plasmid) [Comamonadaceae bacterium OTU4NAUVB1]|jgi:putative copper resistance protein D|nr:copper homeostasis membrane protein CopD [Comamonadaceae bacterium OTU4NAUVB1]
MDLDWWSVLFRFGLYLDFMVLFGTPLFSLYALKNEERSTFPGRVFPKVILTSIFLGFALSVASLVVMVKNMTGATDFQTIESHAFGMILGETYFGTAWIARMLGVVVSLMGMLRFRSSPAQGCILVSLGGAIALGSLAWGGHGAMDEGTRGFLHFTADILHLLAAGAWVGALASFLALAKPGSSEKHFAVLARTSVGFAMVGTIIVVTLLVTGIINFYLIAGTNLNLLFQSAYGRLLLLKLALFAGMLLMAALNRYRLAPRIEAAAFSGNTQAACMALKRSLNVEFSLAVAILLLVAIFGLLSPEIPK